MNEYKLGFRGMPPISTYLLIDGSNVLHAWAETRALVRRNREAAKALLLRKVAVLNEHNGWRITVVFDGGGDDLRIESVGHEAGFACVHSPAGVTADEIIERLVGQSATPAACLVVTADMAERSTIESLGATWCGPEELAKRIDSADTRQLRLLARGNDAARRAWRAAEKADLGSHP